MTTIKARIFSLALVLAAGVWLGGCASVVPPPDRAHWDTAPAWIHCTESESGVNGQYIGGGLLVALSWAAMAGGDAWFNVPILAAGLLVIRGARTKHKQVRECREFREHKRLQQTESALPSIGKD